PAAMCLRVIQTRKCCPTFMKRMVQDLSVSYGVCLLSLSTIRKLDVYSWLETVSVSSLFSMHRLNVVWRSRVRSVHSRTFLASIFDLTGRQSMISPPFPTSQRLRRFIKGFGLCGLENC